MTDRHTERQTPAILLSVPCYAIAMGQIISIKHGAKSAKAAGILHFSLGWFNGKNVSSLACSSLA